MHLGSEWLWRYDWQQSCLNPVGRFKRIDAHTILSIGKRFDDIDEIMRFSRKTFEASAGRRRERKNLFGFKPGIKLGMDVGNSAASVQIDRSYYPKAVRLVLLKLAIRPVYVPHISRATDERDQSIMRLHFSPILFVLDIRG